MPATRDSMARFCSNACRQKAYRARRRPLPVEMTSRARWVRHDAAKRPLTVFGGAASVTDPRTWASYAAVRDSSVGAGMGIVLGDGLGCLDLDEALDAAGRIKHWAQEVLEGYADDSILTEVSVSGRGLHVFLPMSEGPGKRIRDGERKIEIYSRDRYIAVTGKLWGATPGG